MWLCCLGIGQGMGCVCWCVRLSSLEEQGMTTADEEKGERDPSRKYKSLQRMEKEHKKHGE